MSLAELTGSVLEFDGKRIHFSRKGHHKVKKGKSESRTVQKRKKYKKLLTFLDKDTHLGETIIGNKCLEQAQFNPNKA